MNEVGGGQPEQHLELPPSTTGAETVERPAPEQDQPVSEASPGKQAAPPAIQSLPAIPDAQTALPAHPAGDDNQIVVSSPKTAKLPAKEGSKIEKEWIEKAKEIVAETKNDPYKQKNEMSRAKADYIQKRFKKSIKTDNAPA